MLSISICKTGNDASLTLFTRWNYQLLRKRHVSSCALPYKKQYQINQLPGERHQTGLTQLHSSQQCCVCTHPVPLNLQSRDKSKSQGSGQPRERATEAGLEAEPTATALAMMCAGTLQKGDLNLQKKKQRSTSLSIIPSSLHKENIRQANGARQIVISSLASSRPKSMRLLPMSAFGHC